ncbi:efflux RND transporter permease subunit [Ostreiculturibacter nitratireducens]|uniref:efflux RND transporter permease subunit n=1 Tax=Ostreiculturibacter nitratireducens TaxID=3075226 RepID=UPI0031B5DB6F
MVAGPGGILSYFTRHGTAANLVLVVMLAVGLAALPRMRAQYFPDVIVEEITVSVAWEGAGAEDVDRAIVQVLEPTLLVVEGVETTSSRAAEGNASITLEFEPGWNMSRAMDDVEAAVTAAGSLPSDAEDPEIRQRVWRDRVTEAVITGPVSVGQLGRFADEFVARLFAEGVTRTTIQGLAAPETIVEVPSANLIRHDVSMAEIASAIAAEAAADPAGDVSGGAARVRTGVEKRSPEALAAIVLRTNPDGSALTIGDVARIRVEGADRARAYFVGENPAMAVRVDRSDLGDAIGIHETVAEVAAEMELTLPPGTSIDLIRSRAENITARLNLLIDNGAMGLGLVVTLLFLFLNARTAFWVAIGIPVSMLAALAAMQAFGLTLNMISLFALILTLGIVVDDAIVVGEHADFRARRLGEPPVEAAENAARRMAGPVTASTLTTVAAFLGLMTISGTFGTLIADIPFTVGVVLLASLIECFLILPNHMAHALVHTAREHWYDWPSRQVSRGFRWVRERLFRPLVAGVIRARYPVLAGAVALLASQAALVVTGEVQWRFFNAPEQGSVTGNFAMLPGASRDDTIEMMRSLRQAAEDVGAAYEAEHGRNPIDYMIAEIGGNAGRALAGSDTKEPELLGAISIELIDPDFRPYSSFDFVARLQEAVPQHPLLEEVSFRGWRSGPGGDALDVELSGSDAPGLKAAAEALKAALAPFAEVSAVEDSLAYDKDELILDLTPQGQALGFTIDDLGRVLRNRLNGIEAASFPEGPRSATVRVELPEEELTADFLERTMLRTTAGNYVPLADIVAVTTRSGFSAIRRENGLRLVSVTGDISEDDPDRAAEIMQTLEAEILPRIAEEHGVAFRLSGLSEQEDTFLNDALLGLAAALLAIYLILAWIFSSWLRPLVVMSVIPFGLVGAIWGHAWWGVPLSMFSVVGLIGMSGIIINDSIVLISTVDDYARNRGLRPAIADAVADRLRPVFLTTATTVFGLAPLLYETSSQAQFLKPTVITLVYGLGFGMVLVLLVVPALLAAQDDIGRQVRAFRRAFRATGTAATLTLATIGVGIVFALTMGRAILAGEGAFRAFGLFVAGSAAVAVAALIIGALALRRGGFRTGSP